MKSSASLSSGSRRAMVFALVVLPVFAAVFPAGAAAQGAATSGQLPSWSDMASKNAIVAFVERVTRQDSPEFVPVADRIARFESDGVLGAELPKHFQFLFALSHTSELGPPHFVSEAEGPFASPPKDRLVDNELALPPVVMATDADMNSEEVDRVVRVWIGAARHPITGRAYAGGVHRPMLELVAFLRADGFEIRYGEGRGAAFSHYVVADHLELDGATTISTV
jgi:hypothetical protein